MKAVQFVFYNEVYFAPTENEAKNFLDFWGATSFINPMSVENWKITSVEVAPSWVPRPVIDPFYIEYGKTN